MANVSEMLSPPALDDVVVQAPPEVAAAARAVAQALPPAAEPQVRSADVQKSLKEALLTRVAGWTDVVTSIEAGFDARGIVLVRGLPFDPENRLVVGLIAALGRPSGFGNWNGHVVFDLFPIERAPGDPDFEQNFHTGSQMHPRPHEILALQCVRPGSAGGGVSKLVTLGATLAIMRQQGNAAAIETLRGRLFPFARPKFLIEGIVGARIFEPWADGPDGLMVRFQREPIFKAAAELPTAFDDEMRTAIAAFETAMNSPGAWLEYQLRADELVIIDNRHVLHARTAVVGGKESGRHLKRVKAYRP